MSWPVAKIHCDRCDFSSNTMVTWGRFEYRLADGRRLPVGCSMGWCHTCDKIVPVERFFDRDTLDEEIAEFRERIEHAQPSWISTWLLPWRARRGRDDQAYWQKELEGTLNRRDFLDQRQSPPRCLRCADTAITLIGFVIPIEDEPPERMDFLHPGCGGHRWIVNDGLRIAMRYKEILVYDGEGFFLHKQNV